MNIYTKIDNLKFEYDKLKRAKEKLLDIIDKAEISESVYNSNAIENSTLTLKETEKIIMEMEAPKNASLREVFEAKNLAKLFLLLKNRDEYKELSKETILYFHKILMENINDNISGRFRKKEEYVIVGMHIGSDPKNINKQITDLLVNYSSDNSTYFLEKIAKFHLSFESVHPFNDGNGRIGRFIINFQFNTLGFPNVIVKNKEKQEYYMAFNEFNDTKTVKPMVKILTNALTESLYKRLAYLKGLRIVKLSEFVKIQKLSGSSMFNSAKRQTIPAFRERGIWKIGVK